MQVSYVIKENWLTRKPRAYARDAAALFSLFVAFASLYYLASPGAGWMVAQPGAVFGAHEWWRAWTTLFAHADFGHFFSNIILFIPLAYLLSAYFSPLFFPGLGILAGGLANLLVLTTLPPDTTLLGISGVVYWMGAAWLTLFLLIDRRERLKRRFGSALFLALMLFVPETLRPEVSHLSHFLGFVSGAASGGALYALQRKEILAAEAREAVPLDLSAFTGDEDFFATDRAANECPSQERPCGEASA